MSEDLLSETQVAAFTERLTQPLGLPGILGTTLTLAAKTAAVGLPLALLLGLGNTAGTLGMFELWHWAEGQTQETRALIYNAAFVFAGFCGSYAAIQFFKRNTASRTSWVPALFCLPALGFGLAMWLIGGEFARQMPPAVVQPLVMAWTLIWASFAGAGAVIGWVRSGNEAAEGRPVDIGAVLSEAGRRMPEVAAVHGGKTTAIFVGMQIIVVGIFYALQLAFADMVAVLDPEKPAMRRAGQLSFGMRSRIFRVLAVWFFAQGLVYAGVVVAIDGEAAYMASFLDFSALTPTAYFAGDAVLALFTWLTTLSLLVMYRDREAQVQAKAALRANKKLQAAGPS